MYIHRRITKIKRHL